MKKEAIGAFQKKKYLQNLKLLSTFSQEKSSAYIYLVATLVSLSFLVLFAIGPTIGTIVELQKKLLDSETAYAQLVTKKQSLNALQQRYAQLSLDLPLIANALPKTPAVTDFLGRLQGIAKESGVRIVGISSSEITLSKAVSTEAPATAEFFDFSVNVSGNYASVAKFFNDISNFDRVVSITSYSVSREEETQGSRALNLQGKAYYQL